MTYQTNDPNDPNFRTNPPRYPDESPGTHNTSLWVALALAIIVVIGGLFYMANRDGTPTASNTTTPAQTTGSGTTTPRTTPVQPTNPAGNTPASPAPQQPSR